MNEQAPASCERFVLVVDDDADVRETIEEVLRDNEYCAVGAGNGQEALQRLRSEGRLPCVILLDMMMPVMDGWQFRAAQREDQELGAVPVIVLTAHQCARDVATDIEATDYLTKPVQLSLLLQLIKRYCA